jgi:hypothetical protein
LFGDLSTETRFAGLHQKRADALYQKLFLNKKVIQPICPAFELDPATGDIKLAFDPKTGQPILDPGTGLRVPSRISAHHPALLAALGIREEDLPILTSRADGTRSIQDELTLANVSLLWRHAWVAKVLKFKPAEWQTVLKLLQQDVPRFADPKTALEFVEKVDHLKATGFGPDELNWVLAADRSAKAAVKQTDAARFLTTLRTELQRVRREYDPARYEFLEPPADVDRLATLLVSLLQQLHRDEAGAKFFVDTLRDEVIQERSVGLPAGFTFPAAITGPPQHIRIAYEPVLQFGGVMTAAQRVTLLTDPSLAAVTASPLYQKAIQKLFESPGRPAPVATLPPDFSFPKAIADAIPIRYESRLRLTGLIIPAQRVTLLTDALLAPVTGIPAYRSAIEAFYSTPRLALKFLDPVFTAPLASLPATVDFSALTDSALARKISYDAEERALR